MLQLMKELRFLTLLFCVAVCGSHLEAGVVYPLEMLTSNGEYYDGSDLNLYVEVIDGQSTIDFMFRNESSIDSSIARIYFEDSPHLGTANLVGGPGTSFSQPAAPKNIPGAKLLEPAFDVTDGFSIGADAPPSQNGVNPDEWLQITFDLANNGTFEDVINELDMGAMRIGVHVIALPDGSSGSALAVPEPATILLLGIGGALLTLTRKRRYAHGRGTYVCTEMKLHKMYPFCLCEKDKGEVDEKTWVFNFFAHCSAACAKCRCRIGPV